MFFSKQELGKQGEDFAKKLYLKEGFHLLAQNYRCRGSELDLIFSRRSELVIVEVKYRNKKHGIRHDELFPHRKLKALKRGTLHFLSHTEERFDTIRFEFVVVCGNSFTRGHLEV